MTPTIDEWRGVRCRRRRDEHVAEAGQRGAEFFDLGLVGLDRVAFGVLGLAFFFDVEADVFEQDDLTGLQRTASSFNFRTDAIIEELHRTTKQFFQTLGDRRQRVLCILLTIRTAQGGDISTTEAPLLSAY